jgi:hypothetical protein
MSLWQKDLMLNVILLKVIPLNANLLIAVYNKCHSVECHSAECSGIKIYCKYLGEIAAKRPG